MDFGQREKSVMSRARWFFKLMQDHCLFGSLNECCECVIDFCCCSFDFCFLLFVVVRNLLSLNFFSKLVCFLYLLFCLKNQITRICIFIFKIKYILTKKVASFMTHRLVGKNFKQFAVIKTQIEMIVWFTNKLDAKASENVW
jgi:hypothetical protein